MKKMIGFLAVCAVGALVWMACDKISDGESRVLLRKIPPYDHHKDDSPIDENLQYVVVEDFTGVKCINCPKAAVVAHTLQNKLKSQLIVIGSHPMGAALTKPYTGDADLRSETSRIYYEFWKQPGLPAGLINRRQEKTVVFDNWTAIVDGISAEKPVATVNQVKATIADGKMTVEASGCFKSDYTKEGDINLILLVLEDCFEVRQEGDEASKEKHNYHHDHVLRTSIGDAWGVKVLNAKPKAEAKFTHTASVELNADWKKDKLSVVALLTNASTREIINAAKVKVK